MRAVLAAFLVSFSACSSKRSFEGVKAPTLSSSEPVSLAECPEAKCLTVYVAPWCPYCRAATPMIVALREYLKSRGVATRVIVGLDKAEPVRRYAQAFGPDTFLDPEGRVSPPGGVPAFLISDASGKVVRRRSGAPQVAPPFNDEVLAQVAALYGLP